MAGDHNNLLKADEAASNTAADRIIGKRYRVIRLLGKGGMGAVYEAENTWTKRRVAVKVMSTTISNSEPYVKRFMQEAQTAAQLSHPNIVDVLDMGQDEATSEIFLVQELLNGHDLGEHLDAAGRMPVFQALDVIMPVMDALVVAHARGVVHRDLKPDNIFLAETPRGVVPTLIDFGIAKVLADEDALQRTGTGMLLGTPYYMSPEQARGETSLDGRSDVWSIGVVLYELISGARPYRAANANALIAKIIYEQPMPLDVAAPELPRELVDVVMGAVQPDLTKRYPTMQAFLDAVRPLAGEARVTPAPTSLTSIPAPQPSAPLPETTATRTPPAREETLAPLTMAAPSRRRRWAIPVAFVGMSAVAVAVGLLAASHAPSTQAGVQRAAAAPVTVLRPPAVEAASPVEAVPAPPPPVAPVVVAAPATSDAGSPSVARRPAAERLPRVQSHDSARPGAPVPPRIAAPAGRPTLPTVRGTVPLE